VSGEKPREIAIRVLSQRSGGDYIEHLLEHALGSASLSPADRRLCLELVYGVVRWESTLDWLIARKTGGRTQKHTLQILLRLGLYQILWLERIPGHAAVNETVNLAKTFGFGPQSGFVNAILRGYLRELVATKAELETLKSSQPHLGYSHPEWLVQRWGARYGQEQALKLLSWNNLPPRTYARVNTLKADPAKLLEQWRQENVDYDFFRRDWFPENTVFELKQYPALAGLPSFQQGKFYVQDPSTLLAVRELEPRPGETVLDLCAAPGGKLTYAAELMQNRGKILGQDSSGARLKLVAENCGRLGVTCAEIQEAMPAEAKSSGQFDRVLLDAPCSNTGVMRRRVDLRWRIRLEELARLRGSQLELLRRGADLLKPGGTLVYSTCSLEPEENREVVNEFLGGRTEFRLVADRELKPFADGVDGAYAARLQSAKLSS
jgi:16S rRNA (cytosine967-C5)-methyltransferase